MQRLRDGLREVQPGQPLPGLQTGICKPNNKRPSDRRRCYALHNDKCQDLFEAGESKWSFVPLSIIQGAFEPFSPSERRNIYGKTLNPSLCGVFPEHSETPILSESGLHVDRVHDGG